MNKERYVVWVHVAPYVCRYLIDNFGVQDAAIPNLVDIRRDQGIMAFLSAMLTKPPHRYDKRNESRRNNRSERVAILISADRFLRSGWALSPTAESKLAHMLELRCQGMLITFLHMHYCITGCLADSIRAFYRRFRQTEETWPYDSIRKIWNRRYGIKEKNNMKKQLFRAQINEIEGLFMEQMSQNGTITQKGIMEYEKD